MLVFGEVLGHDVRLVLIHLNELNFNDPIFNVLADEVLSFIDVIGSFNSGVLRNEDLPFIIHIDLDRKL